MFQTLQTRKETNRLLNPPRKPDLVVADSSVKQTNSLLSWLRGAGMKDREMRSGDSSRKLMNNLRSSRRTRRAPPNNWTTPGVNSTGPGAHPTPAMAMIVSGWSGVSLGEEDERVRSNKGVKYCC